MAIRELGAIDLDAVLAIYSHLHAADDSAPERSAVESVWRSITSSEHLKYFGYFEREALLATCHLVVVPNLTRGCRPYGLIENVVTHAAHRRRGFGRAVLQHALQHAWSAGCYKVMLATGRKGEATRRFYESAGFDSNGKQAFIARPPRP